MVDEDHKGRPAVDLSAARDIAAKSVMELLRAEHKTMTGAVIEIRDESKDLVATVPVNLAAESVAGER